MTLTADTVTDAALAEIDEHGIETLTIAAVADRTGVRGPSLYKHVPGIAALRSRVAVRVLAEITDALTSAAIGRSGPAALSALMHSYRDYAVANPNRYAVVPPDPLRDPRTAEAAQRQIEVILAVLHGSGITGSDAIHVMRGLRAMAHGFAEIESSGGFGLNEDIDESFRRMVDGFLLTMSHAPRRDG